MSSSCERRAGGQCKTAGGESHRVSLSSRSIQDIAILFNIIIIFLMFFNTFVFQAGLVNLLFHKFKGTILLSAAYLALSISFHVWVMVGTGRDNLVSPCDSCTNTGLEGSRPISKNPPFLLGEAQRLQLRAAQEPALG